MGDGSGGPGDTSVCTLGSWHTERAAAAAAAGLTKVQLDTKGTSWACIN